MMVLTSCAAPSELSHSAPMATLLDFWLPETESSLVNFESAMSIYISSWTFSRFEPRSIDSTIASRRSGSYSSLFTFHVMMPLAT